MIRLTHNIPHVGTLKLAFSGGIDSLVAAHFYRRRTDILLCHFNHGCEYSDQIMEECKGKAKELNLPLVIGFPQKEREDGQSLEDYWRRERYRFLYEEEGLHVVTAHHLDDAIETWVWSSLHGEGKVIDPMQSVYHADKVNCLHRPFLLTPKRKLVAYAERHRLKAVHDPFNEDTDLTRNYIRANMMQHVRVVNPGIEKVIRKKYLDMGF